LDRFLEGPGPDWVISADISELIFYKTGAVREGGGCSILGPATTPRLPSGWIVWRQREGLSEHVAISVSYLGGKADSYAQSLPRDCRLLIPLSSTCTMLCVRVLLVSVIFFFFSYEQRTVIHTWGHRRFSI